LPTARVQARALYIEDSTKQGNCAYLNEGLTNTRVNIYGAQGFDFQLYCVVGTGVTAPSIMAGFGSGFDGFNNPPPTNLSPVSVTNSGNLLINQGWFEGYAAQFLDFETQSAPNLTTTGNFTWDGGMLAFLTAHTNTLTLLNYVGQLTMTGINFHFNSGYINV